MEIVLDVEVHQIEPPANRWALTIDIGIVYRRLLLVVMHSSITGYSSTGSSRTRNNKGIPAVAGIPNSAPYTEKPYLWTPVA